MVKAKSRHSLQRQPIQKLQQGAFRSDETTEQHFSYGEESREEFNLSFHHHKRIIRDHHNSSIPPWDMRAAPPAVTNVNSNQQKVSYANQKNDPNAQLFKNSNQWDGSSAHPGVNRQRRSATSQNIWSSENQSFQKDSDSLYSTSTNPSIGAFSLSTLNSSSQRNNNRVQYSNNRNIQDISKSLHQLQLNGTKHDDKTVAASISSNTTYSNNTVPGLVGASSGSTGGTGVSAFSDQQLRPNLNSQSMMNSDAQVFYPNHYGLNQERAPPGFRSYQYHESILNPSLRMLEESNPMYQRDSLRRKGGNRQDWKNHSHVDFSRASNNKKGFTNRKNRSKNSSRQEEVTREDTYATEDNFLNTDSQVVRMIMNPHEKDLQSSGVSVSSSNTSLLAANRLPLDSLAEDSNQMPAGTGSTLSTTCGRSILPSMNDIELNSLHDDEYKSDNEEEYSYFVEAGSSLDDTTTTSKKKDWLLRMNRRLTEVPIGDMDPSSTPISAIMNAWAKTKSSHGASMVEKWLERAQEEFDAGNTKVVPTNKMFTMAVDAWAKSGEGVSAAQRAETILQHMNKKYQITGLENLRPTTGIFNAVINAWARSKEKIAPSRAEQILKWMDNLHKTNPSIKPDKYTFNTVIHAYAKTGGVGAAKKAQDLLDRMHVMYQEGNDCAKPDTITYNVVINSLAKSGGKDAAVEAEKLLSKMHKLYENGDVHVKPNVVTYGAVIDAYAKSGEKFAAARADALLAKMIHLHQMDSSTHSDLSPNTYVFNTVINAHAKSKAHDAASKAEEMLLAMNRLHLQGIPNLKPDAFTYTAVIDAWAKSGYRGAAARADQLLDTMESKYLAGDVGLKPNTFTYNAVINALAKSGEPSAAARAERVLHNMVNRHKHGASDDVKPTTINFNSVLDAWAKSGGGRKAAERAEEILEWMDRLYKSGNYSVRPDTITFNAVLDAWARSGDRMAAHRAEQILDHMDELYRAGNQGVKPDTYTYNTLINAHAKSSEKGSAARAEHVLQVMKQRYLDGDGDFKPNTRTHTSVIDAWAKSGEKGAARRAEQILNSMIASFEESGDYDSKPNVHTANAVCNACAFTRREEDRHDALQIAFRVYDWLADQPNMEPDAYTYTILLSVCSNLLPREDRPSRFSHAKSFFEKCCESGHVNDYVLRKLRQTVSEQEYLTLVNYQGAGAMPPSWTRNIGHKNTRFSNSLGGGSSIRSKNATRSNHSRRRGNNK